MIGRIRTAVSRQLSSPHGRAGQLIAAAMNRGNDAMNDAAISELGEVCDRDVLELGFGGGRSVSKLLDAGARVIGVEPAQDMVERARHRFGEEIAAGTLSVHEGPVEQLPLADDCIDLILTVNTVYFWPELEPALSEIRRVLRPGGRVVIAIRDGRLMENVDRSIFSVRPPEQIAAALEGAGLSPRIESPADQRIHLIVGESAGRAA